MNKKQVKPGMKFYCDQVHIVVKRNRKIPGDWWCRGLEEDVGLWSFNEQTILDPNRRVKK